ncbi:HAD family hydrolase [Jatrophihabitans endophyticus]|uniref:HAD family hydrolase n=1 Tax=Jatrophihabitans endophyticus TaxID=1206085 RepID=UPI0019EE97CA|nr:HAD family hydrolase [Jatrophihabitans endophyticus]MBE7189096.1 HAD family hydrolase [Jatrophihabitans endophyticus]
MTRGIRLVATDLDGTLLRGDGTVSDRTRAAIKAATAAGLVVAFVTGRPPRWLDDVIEQTDHVGLAVGANGAVLYDMSDQRLLSVHTLDPALMIELGDELRAAFPDVGFAVEYGDGFAAEAGYTHDWDINPRLDRHGNPIPAPRIAPLADIATAPALKLLAKDRSADPDDFLASATRVIGTRASITHSSSYGLLEIARRGVTKASGLAELAGIFGIAQHEVAAIGDMPNDVPMLEWAGESYAVANGHPATKAVADAVVASNEDDAVAELIEGLLA